MTDEEIANSAYGLGEKGVAWDYIAHWVPKLLVKFAPVEVIDIYRKIKLLNGNFSHDCIEAEKLLSQFNELYDEDYTDRQFAKGKAY